MGGLLLHNYIDMNPGPTRGTCITLPFSGPLSFSLIFIQLPKPRMKCQSNADDLIWWIITSTCRICWAQVQYVKANTLWKIGAYVYGLELMFCLSSVWLLQSLLWLVLEQQQRCQAWSGQDFMLAIYSWRLVDKKWPIDLKRNYSVTQTLGKKSCFAWLLTQYSWAY